jgi:hypothetical protein
MWSRTCRTGKHKLPGATARLARRPPAAEHIENRARVQPWPGVARPVRLVVLRTRRDGGFISAELRWQVPGGCMAREAGLWLHRRVLSGPLINRPQQNKRPAMRLFPRQLEGWTPVDALGEASKSHRQHPFLTGSIPWFTGAPARCWCAKSRYGGRSKISHCLKSCCCLSDAARQTCCVLPRSPGQLAI